MWERVDHHGRAPLNFNESVCDIERQTMSHVRRRDGACRKKRGKT
jgi:hypothetical protein